CVFDATLKGGNNVASFSPTNPAYKDIVENGLVMNVYRDGQWGSFRHHSIDWTDTGKKKRTRKRSRPSRAQSGLEQPGAKVAGVARLRCRVPDPNARSPTCPGRSSWSPSTRRYAASRSSGRDCSWPRSWCPSLASGPKPPVEGGTSCAAFPAGNERGASTEPYPPSGSDVLTGTLPRRRCRRQHRRLIDFCLSSLAVFNTTGGEAKTVTQCAYLHFKTRGDLSSLQWYESPLGYTSPYPETSKAEVICDVYYAPVNFHDAMIATGKVNDDGSIADVTGHGTFLGTEFSGRDPDGRRVMGCLGGKCIATTVAADPFAMWEVPEWWTLEEAATVPVAYSTAYYALIVRGDMQPGESILVHSGSGGVGQAAISIALSMGCTVFTTVGSEKKRNFLKRRFPQLEDRHFANSRDRSFEEHIKVETRGRGVDLVLNSLSEEKLQASVRCLAPHGRFLEIGKFDLFEDNNLGMSVFLRNVTFHGIMTDSLQTDDPATPVHKRRIVELIREGIASGVVRPLDIIKFPRDQAEQAFRFVASGKHIGKVLIEIRPEETQLRNIKTPPGTLEAVARPCFYRHKSYIIVGGLGGFGLELAEWMISRGCYKLLLISRTGVRTGYQRLCLHRWSSLGATVLVSKEDVSTEQGARKVIENAATMGPVGGIFNLAMVLHDALIDNQSAETYEEVCKPKVRVTQHLDDVSRKQCPCLDHFVVFSSLASGRGNAGQTNYGYANSFMERVCERRVEDGLPGLAIQWGAVGDVGVLHDNLGADVTVGGLEQQSIRSCMAVMDAFLSQSHPVVSSFVKRSSSTAADCKDKGDLVQNVAHVLGIKDASTVNPSITLGELGIDSLMTVEVRQLLERDYDVALSMQEVRQLSVAQLREISEACTNREDMPASSDAVEANLDIPNNGHAEMAP
ncbi:hypothetical protein MTO96_037783, partial [Rhipicephalus appendiculatus]